MDVAVLGMLKKYIQETLVGMGALKGAPCQVKDIVNADGSHTITLKWVDDESVSHESSFTVKDGKDGTDGIDGTDGVSPSIVVSETIAYGMVTLSLNAAITLPLWLSEASASLL